MRHQVAKKEAVKSPPVKEDYVTLYRKYRPSKFADLIGQETVANGLATVIKEGRFPHAFLLTGPRGCGKTSTARIIASAVNCPNMKDGEPCAQCDVCEAIETGNFMGIVNELNAADHRSIDSMRSLLEGIALSVSANYKVYILDEVHQLTKDAASLLLKHLEEPPNGNILFILATTDAHKVLDTIKSRTVVFNFKLLNEADMDKVVRRVLDGEGLTMSDEQIASIISAGRGSPRDTISAIEAARMGIEMADSNFT